MFRNVKSAQSSLGAPRSLLAPYFSSVVIALF